MVHLRAIHSQAAFKTVLAWGYKGKDMIRVILGRENKENWEYRELIKICCMI